MIHSVTKMTPLHWAVFNDDKAVGKALVDGGADPYVFSVMKTLPIDIAGVLEDYDMVQSFLQKLDEGGIVIKKDVPEEDEE